MIKKIFGVILGYVVIVVSVIMTRSAFYLAIGADGAYYRGTFDVSPLWIGAILVLSFITAFAGGYVCRRIALGSKSVTVLAGITLALGLAVAVGKAVAAPIPAEIRTADVSNYDAMKKARHPVWLFFADPIVGFAGILIGGQVAGRKEQE